MVDFREAAPVIVHEVDSLDEQFQRIRARIEGRAYDRFLSRGAVHGHDVDDWLAAESELVITPQLNMVENGDEIMVVARFVEFSLGELELFATPNEALLTSFVDGQRQAFAIFHFPRLIVVRSIDAEVEGNVFHLVANVANSIDETSSAHAHVA